MDSECEFDCEAFQGQHEGPVKLYTMTKDGKTQAWHACDKGAETARRAGYEVVEVPVSNR